MVTLILRSTCRFADQMQLHGYHSKLGPHGRPLSRTELCGYLPCTQCLCLQSGILKLFWQLFCLFCGQVAVLEPSLIFRQPMTLQKPGLYFLPCGCNHYYQLLLKIQFCEVNQQTCCSQASKTTKNVRYKLQLLGKTTKHAQYKLQLLSKTTKHALYMQMFITYSHLVLARATKEYRQLCRQVVMFAALLLWVSSKLCGFSLVPAQYNLTSSIPATKQPLPTSYTRPTFAN